MSYVRSWEILQDRGICQSIDLFQCSTHEESNKPTMSVEDRRQEAGRETTKP